MRHLLTFLFSLVLLQAFAADNYGSIKAEYVRNYDGDTITVNIPGWPGIIGKNITVRVKGIDTPEVKGKSEKEKQLARTARRLVTSLLKNAKIIELRNMGRDKYFRILADVYYDNNNLAEILIKNKLAVSYDGGTKITDWSKI